MVCVVVLFHWQTRANQDITINFAVTDSTTITILNATFMQEKQWS